MQTTIRNMRRSRLKSHIFRKKKNKPTEKMIEGNENMLIPQRIPNNDIEIELNEMMKQDIIPKGKESLVICGSTGSGKTNLLMWLLLNPNMYHGYFNEIFLFSPTAEIDPMFKRLKLKQKNMISSNIVNQLEKLVENKRSEVKKKGIKNTKCDLILIEDSSAEGKLLNSNILTKAFTQLRHFGCSIWIVTHQYKTLRPTCRRNSNHLIIFPCTKDQQLLIADDYGSHNVGKKSLLEMMEYAFRRDPNNQRPFFYINNKSNPNEKFRKCFHEILEPN